MLKRDYSPRNARRAREGRWRCRSKPGAESRCDTTSGSAGAQFCRSDSTAAACSGVRNSKASRTRRVGTGLRPRRAIGNVFLWKVLPDALPRSSPPKARLSSTRRASAVSSSRSARRATARTGIRAQSARSVLATKWNGVTPQAKGPFTLSASCVASSRGALHHRLCDARRRTDYADQYRRLRYRRCAARSPLYFKTPTTERQC
jgi:hypothetical protein